MSRALQLAKPWLPAIAYMALIALFSSQSGHAIQLDHVPLRDKGVHFVEFAVLAMLIARALAAPHKPLDALSAGRRWKIALWAIALSTLWGYLDEVHQAFVPGRTADAWDLLADHLGALTGTAIYSLAIARKRSQEATR